MKEGHPLKPDRENAIAWILEQMQVYGLFIKDLQAQGYFDAPSPPSPAALIGPVHVSVDGRHWDGSGGMLDWLQRIADAGQNIEHFHVG